MEQYLKFYSTTQKALKAMTEDDPVILKYWIIEADRYKDVLMSRYQNKTLINDMFMEAFNGFNYGRHPAVTLEAFNKYYKKNGGNKQMIGIEQITLKSGQEVIIMSHRDIIDTIRDTLGNLLADLVAAELAHATKSYEDELKGYEADIQEKEGIADSYAASLRDISDELDVLEGLLEAPRLNRDKVKASTENIRKIIDGTF